MAVTAEQVPAGSPGKPSPPGVGSGGGFGEGVSADRFDDQLDAGALALTVPGEMIKSVQGQGSTARLTEHLGHEWSDPARRDRAALTREAACGWLIVSPMIRANRRPHGRLRRRVSPRIPTWGRGPLCTHLGKSPASVDIAIRCS